MDIISAILDIDNKAREMMLDANRKSAEILSKAAEDEQMVRTDIMNEVERKLSALEQSESANAQKRVEAIGERTEAEKLKLTEMYESKHEEWSDSLFEDISGMC